MIATSLFRPHRPEQEDTGRGWRGQQSVEPLKRVGIAPLHIVEKQHGRLPNLSDSGGKGFVEVKALPAFSERTGLSGRLADFGHQPRQFRELLWREISPARANNIGTE